jgi:hypothetical protein
MPFIYKNEDIRDRRVKLFVDNLHQAFTRLMLIDKEAADLIDAEQEQADIAALSVVDGETFPVLPFGDELVFQFNSIDLDFDSESKFIFEKPEGQDLRDILELEYAEEGEELPQGTTKLDNGLKLRDGFVIFKNLEEYDYDYKSYEVLNEIYRALEIFFASVEAFYSKYFVDEISENNTIVLVFDTEDIDDELFNRVFPVADTITDPENREAVKERYRLIRDEIKFWAMGDIVLRIDAEIDRLLYCINASKKYSVQQNIETKQLELIYDDNGKQRRIHKDEEVYFPFHNKPTLNEFLIGIQGKY